MDDDQFQEQFRKRLASFTTPENVERALRLGDHIGSNSRPDHEIGVRLTRVMSPFLQGDEDLEWMQYLATFATNAWNITLMPEDQRKGFTDFFLGAMLGDDKGTIEELRRLTEEMVRVKLLLYPDDLRFIGDCDVKQDGNRFTVTASAGPDYMAGDASPASFPLGLTARDERDIAIAERLGKQVEDLSFDDVLKFVQDLESRVAPDPEVSERLMQIVSPHLRGDEDAHTMELLGIAGMVAWNASSRPASLREIYLEEAAANIALDHERDAFLQLVHMFMPSKAQLFPDDQRIVTDVEVRRDGERFVFVAMVPPDLPGL